MEQKPSLNRFGTFLETIRKPAAGPSADRPMIVLRELARSGPEPIRELMRATQMGIIEFAESVKTMQDIGLLRVTGPAGGETVELTPTGSQLIAAQGAPGHGIP